MAEPTDEGGAIPLKPCPICGRPAHPKRRPFCSGRCAEIDLHRWLGGVYRIEEEGEDGFPGLPGEDENL
jgi:endogenous inhibitor of DNA gyrase (YacG/DUF329 family)